MNQKDQNSPLFSEFPPVPTAQWEEKILTDLKGADYSRKLIWKTDEGFDIKPYYRSEDLDALEYLKALPGAAPFTRGLRKDGNNWIIREDVLAENISEANKNALDAIERGADAIGFRVKEISTHTQMNQLLAGIDLTKTGVHFIASRSYPLTLELFLYELNHRGMANEKVAGSMNFDPSSYMLLHGDFYKSPESNMNEAEYLVNTVRKRIPGFKAISVNGQYFTDAGGTIVEELAFSLSSANEYIVRLTEKGLSIDDIAPYIQFSFGIGSSYFLEIAKLRAARFLWSKIVEQYKPANSDSQKMFIHCTTARWNKTYFDPYVNMLRTTTEGMAAAIGNADSISVIPFDFPFREPGDFSRRIARNQQLILKEEAYLDKVADPSAGSYFIENLTASIAAGAWELFLGIEDQEGFTACIRNGFIQDRINASAQKKEMDIAQRKTVIIGTNQYPNLTEELPEGSVAPAAEPDKIAAVFKIIWLYRGAEGFEEVRRTTENSVKNGHKRPAVFLLPIGNLTLRKARATFSTNFFGCAGFEIIDKHGCKTVEEGIQQALQSNAEIVVICSSDEEYGTLGTEIATGLKKERPGIQIVVAGFPKDILEDLKTAGVDDFIHIRSNVLETLRKFQKILGITN